MRGRSGLANDAWEALLTAHAKLMRGYQAADIWDGVTMREYDVLYALSKSATPLPLGDLTRFVLLSQPALSRMVDRLVGRGLVERAPDREDGRRVLLSLSDAGRQLQREIGRRHARSVAAAMSPALTDEELAQLEQLCRRLVQTDERGAPATAPET